jgi:hypothetical protein
MAEIVNLRKARKAKARAEKGRMAESNRVKFGRTGAEKRAIDAERDRDGSRLDGHRLDGLRIERPSDET